MLSKKKKSGYCPSCHKNVPHQRHFNNPVTLLFNKVTLGLLGVIGVGPWYCVHCDNKKFLLLGRDPKALDYRSAALGNETPVRTRKQTKPALKTPAAKANNTQPIVKANSTAAPKPETEPAVPVGNFLKSDKSLVNRKHRLERFSEKYRDAVVRRILNGTATISQIRNDKRLSETEVAEWIADLFDRRQKRIDDLEKIVEAIAQAKLLSQHSSEPAMMQTAERQTKPR